MKKLLTAFLVLSAWAAPAQSLFSFGKETVTIDEFLRAYKRNNTGASDETAFRNYLELYIAARLKIKEAHALGLDTLPQVKADLAALREQIAGSYVIDRPTMQQLEDEAFSRAQKDLRVQHIFISFKDASPDQLAAANKKKEDVMAALQKGASFSKLAEEYSDDPTAKFNGGDLGWITVFSLPYQLENLAYTTAVGKYSGPVESVAGFHFIKTVEERRAVGRIKAAQILLAFPPNADDAQKQTIKSQADSLYTLLKNGAEFGELAMNFSNDLVSAASKGMMQEFGPGTYDPAFEQAVFAMQPGSVSQPLLMEDGYHIVKLLDKIPVPANLESAKEWLSGMINQSDRIDFLKTGLATKLLKEKGKQFVSNESEISALADSALNGRKSPVPVTLKKESVLLQLGNEKFTAEDWLNYAAANKVNITGTGTKSLHRLWNQFLINEALNYYTAHLEDFNEEFRMQMKEFEEGNLFFEIMQRKVWTPAQSDSAGLLQFYQRNKEKYRWQKSADAIVFYAPSKEAAMHFISHLSSPANWRSALDEHSEMTADSSRHEWEQIPGSDKTVFESGKITPVLVNIEDNTASFAYIIKTYDSPEVKTLNQAKVAVITDYQVEIESKWVTALKKKYPVKLNQKVWDELVQSGRWK